METTAWRSPNEYCHHVCIECVADPVTALSPGDKFLVKNRNYNFLRGLEYILISPHCQGISFLSWLEQFPHPTVLPERLSSYCVNLNFNSVNKPPTFVEISGITASSNF